MSDIVKVTLHTPTANQSFELCCTGRMSYEQDGVVMDLIRDKYRLTLVGVLDKEELRIGVAICNTKTDQFSKKYGVQLATARALVKPIEQHGRLNGEWDKKKVLEKLKDLHMEIGNDLQNYKRQLHGI